VATTTGLMTVEQYRQLPEGGAFYYELRNGELVEVSRPTMGHARKQRRLRKLMEAIYGERGVWETEVAFRALPEYEVRVADVAYLAGDRWRKADGVDNIQGAPEVVIEIISPSNTATELADKCALCLDHGCQQFWTVDSKRCEIKVSTPDGLTRTYKSGDQIPLILAGDETLAVDAVFEIE
jgi:Uma2 family endonuclease